MSSVSRFEYDRLKAADPQGCFALILTKWSLGEKYLSSVTIDTIRATTPADHGPLARYVNMRVLHAPGMLGTFSPPPRVSDPDMHHGTCVTHVP